MQNEGLSSQIVDVSAVRIFRIQHWNDAGETFRCSDWSKGAFREFWTTRGRQWNKDPKEVVWWFSQEISSFDNQRSYMKSRTSVIYNVFWSYDTQWVCPRDHHSSLVTVWKIPKDQFVGLKRRFDWLTFRMDNQSAHWSGLQRRQSFFDQSTLLRHEALGSYHRTLIRAKIWNKSENSYLFVIISLRNPRLVHWLLTGWIPKLASECKICLSRWSFEQALCECGMGENCHESEFKRKQRDLLRYHHHHHHHRLVKGYHHLEKKKDPKSRDAKSLRISERILSLGSSRLITYLLKKKISSNLFWVSWLVGDTIFRDLVPIPFSEQTQCIPCRYQALFGKLMSSRIATYDAWLNQFHKAGPPIGFWSSCNW